MKKEVLIAVIVGFSLGLVITFGIYRAQKSIKDRSAEQTTEEAESQPDTTRHQLTITQPEDDSIVAEDEVTVSGITSKNATVAVVSSDDEAAIQADEFGNFSVTVEISSGANTISVVSYDENGNSSATELTVVFSTADLDEEVEETIDNDEEVVE